MAEDGEGVGMSLALDWQQVCIVIGLLLLFVLILLWVIKT